MEASQITTKQERRFQVYRTTYSFADMLEANESDTEFCKWLNLAEIGDVFEDGEGCTRVSDGSAA